MKIIELKPIKENLSDYDKIEKVIKKAFIDVLYKPLLKELGIQSVKIKNASTSDLEEALREGRVTYSEGAFRGKFNSSISKELKALGAIWDRKTSSFKIKEEALSREVQQVVRASEVYFAQRLEAIDERLSQILPAKISEQVKVAQMFDRTLWKVEKDFQKSVENIIVSPELTTAQRAKIADEWQTNMDLWIRDFSEEHIQELRKTVQDAAFAGNRYESLVKGIQTSYDVSANKAKFLARQETSLLMAKFKEARYTSAGVDEYRWGCVKMPHDASPKKHTPGNVRYYHGILEGQIFKWSDPPVTNKSPERRNNPGQDYNCRCFPRPIVKF